MGTTLHRDTMSLRHCTLLLAAVVGALVLPAAADDFACPKPTGIFPDPDDCSRFFECSGGRGYQFHCPDGLLFNAAVLYCDWPRNVDCDQKTTTSRPTSTTQTTSPPKPSTTNTPTSTTNAPTTATTADVETTTTGEAEFDCSVNTNEPINDDIRELRRKSCQLPDDLVERVKPGAASNPANVRILEKLFTADDFAAYFPRANKAYTYTNLLKAFAKFPEVCKTEQLCRKTIVTIFAHFQQETAGLYYLNEINKSPYCADWNSWVKKAYPCYPGKKYFGRGAKQLSWNYNYGAFSNAMFGDTKVLLKNPELVSNTWLNFASAIWFFVTPQPPKPSMLAIVDGSWTPNPHDMRANRLSGFGATIMVINGGIECGRWPTNAAASSNRQRYYRQFAAKQGLHIDAADKKTMGCADMAPFDAKSSAQRALYWAPSGSDCRLATWQTAYSALVEGDYARCKLEL